MVRNRIVRVALAAVGWIAGGLAVTAVGPASAQLEQPAFVDDAPVARDTLLGLGELMARGGRPEAARAVQRLLDDQGNRVIQSEADAALYVSVRDAVHARLLGDAALLATYSEVHEPRAAALLAAGDAALVEATLLLTPSGFEAALRVAQDHLESARFFAAWRAVSQLAIHPAASDPERAAEALGLARVIASYLEPGGRVVGELKRWAGRAGVGVDAVVRIDPPESVLARAAGPLTGGPAADVAGVVPRALSTVRLPGVAADGPGDARGGRGPVSVRGRGQGPSGPVSLPIIAGDRVYANDGVAVSAWDRFTLRPLWSVSPARVSGIGVEGATTRTSASGAVVFAGPILIAATAPEYVPGRGGPAPSVHAIDRATGRVVWSVDPARADARLSESIIAGPPLVTGDTVVVAMRKSVRSRRLISEWLVGLSLADGSPRWVTLVSSAGSLPYQQGTSGERVPVASGGVVFRSDDLGVIAAVDAATGRPVWVRLLDQRDGRVVRGQPRRDFPTAPAVFGDRVFELSGDGRRVLTFDTATGEPGPVNDLGVVGPFQKLVAGDGWLAALSSERAVVLDPETIERDPERLVRFDGPRRSPVGMPTAAGDSLLVPVAAGVLLYDTVRGVERLVELDTPGQTVAADGQFVVASDESLHSYLAWDAAADVLGSRVAQNPGDPSPATTFAELAFSTGRYARIAPAVDQALAALERMADPEAAEAARARLFDAVQTMVVLSQRAWDEPAGEVGGPPRGITDTTLMAGLLDRLAGLAVTPGERVAELLARGRLAEATSRPREALESYQRVLGDGDLSAAEWRGSGLSVRAELEATRRLTALLETQRPSLYEPFDTEALVRFEAAGPDASARTLERIARSYPASVHVVEIWRRAALAHERANRRHDAVRAARVALDAAELLLRLRRDVDPAEVGEAASWLLARLVSADRLDEAAVLVDDLARTFPTAPIVLPEGAVAGGIADAETLLVDLRRRLSEAQRDPVIGPSAALGRPPQVLGGYLLEPIQSITAAGTDVGRSWADGALVMNGVSGELGFVEPAADGSAVGVRWSVSWPSDPVLLRRDAGTAWLMTFDREDGAAVHRVSLTDGAVIWSTPAWRDLVGGVVSADPAIVAGDGPTMITLANGSRVRHRQVVVAGDVRVLVLIERTGRTVALDAAIGRPLWRAAMPVTRVADADVKAGTLLISGVGPAADDGGDLAGLVTIVDAASGQIIATRPAEREGPLWARLAGGNLAILADDNGIAAYEASSFRSLWRLDDQRFAGSVDAILTPTRGFIQRDDDRFGLIDLESGRVIRDVIDDRGRLRDASTLRVVERDSGGFTISTDHGIVGIEADGTLAAMDALERSGELTPAAFASDHAVAVHTRGNEGPGPRQPRFTMHAFDRASGRLRESWPLVLFGVVRRVEAIDGFVLVGVGDAVVAYPFPPE